MKVTLGEANPTLANVKRQLKKDLPPRPVSKPNFTIFQKPKQSQAK